MKRSTALCLLMLVSLPLSRAAVKRHAAKPETTAQAGAITPQFWGMHTLSPGRHWPMVPFGSLRPAGISWGAVETARGVYDWHGVDTWVAAAQSRHVQLDYLFLNTPQWASTRPQEKCNRGPIGCAAPPNDKDWTQFITALATRYRGRIASYEMWNEPNASGYFTGSPADMVHLVSLAYPIIKSIDPQAIVVSPGVSSTGWPTPYEVWINDFLKAGGGKYVDAIAWHSYPGRSNQPALPPEDVVNQIQKVRKAMVKNGYGNLPLWDTEGGWGGDSQLPDEQAQAEFLARWYVLQFNEGVARVFWYQWDSPKWGTLWREGTGETPAAAAYMQVYKWLSGATGATPCAPSSSSIWTCNLLKGNKKFQIAWSTSGPTVLSAHSNFSTYLDLAGEKHPTAGQPLKVGSSPILIQVQ